MPAEIHLLFVLFSNVVKPVLFMQKEPPAGTALQYVPLVSVPRMQDQLVIRLEPFMTLLAFILLMAEKAHANTNAD